MTVIYGRFESEKRGSDMSMQRLNKILYLSMGALAILGIGASTSVSAKTTNRTVKHNRAKSASKVNRYNTVLENADRRIIHDNLLAMNRNTNQYNRDANNLDNATAKLANDENNQKLSGRNSKLSNSIKRDKATVKKLRKQVAKISKQIKTFNQTSSRKAKKELHQVSINEKRALNKRSHRAKRARKVTRHKHNVRENKNHKPHNNRKGRKGRKGTPSVTQHKKKNGPMVVDMNY